MTEPRLAPFGTWASPFPISLLTAGVVRLASVSVDGTTGTIWWLEGRPDDDGRATLVRLRPEADATPVDVSPPGLNVRTRVHEYGGGAYLVDGDLVVVSSFADGRLYRISDGRVADALTADVGPGVWRFADLTIDRDRDRILAIREDHGAATLEGRGEPENMLVAIGLADGAIEVLASGRDFYAAPRLSPDGSSLAWLEWDHPNLPWDGTELRLATIEPDGSLGDGTTIAGDASSWVSQPRWSSDGRLHFVAEPTGWMNLYRWVPSERRAETVAPMAAEFAFPDWQFGYRSYDVAPDGTIAAIARSECRDRLYLIAPGGDPVDLELEATELGNVAWIDDDRLVMEAAAPTLADRIVVVDRRSGWAGRRELRRATEWSPDPSELSVGEPIEFPTAGGRTAHGVFYAPRNARFRGPADERPPLIVTSHGGPTAQAYTGLAVTFQLFTSRGFAVLDVDYGGSTGFGRDYRRRLEGEWGVVDVDDCAAGATWLAGQGRVDGERVAIRGGSASGFTTLAALAFRDTFRAGTSYFGIGDLEAFAKETHKFESRYLDRLVGPLPAMRDRYLERSPSRHADRISAPVLVLQGLDDRIVPPAEAERIVDALWERGVPHAYLAFEGEDHGFRKAETIIQAFEAELSFLGQVFGCPPADAIEPIELIRPGAAG
jgi:dipeptidyl aminopeptidase/acylaminoacyl peptidase